MISQALLSTSRQAARRAAVMPRMAAGPSSMGGAVRAAHVENTIETSMPFKQGPKHKARLAVGVTTFLATGFSLPFVAAWFQH